MDGWLTGAFAFNECDPLLDSGCSTPFPGSAAVMVSQPHVWRSCDVICARDLTPNRASCVDWRVNWALDSVEVDCTWTCQSLQSAICPLKPSEVFRGSPPTGPSPHERGQLRAADSSGQWQRGNRRAGVIKLGLARGFHLDGTHKHCKRLQALLSIPHCVRGGGYIDRFQSLGSVV